MNTETSPAASAEATNADPRSARAKPAGYDRLEDSGNVNGGNDIELVMDVPVQISVELGRSKMQIRHLLALSYGSVIELDVQAGDPLDVTVNGTLVAQGEVVIINEHYAIRLTDIVTPAERLRKLNR